MPHEPNTLPPDLRAFIQAEMARRCLSTEEACLVEILREARARSIDDGDELERLRHEAARGFAQLDAGEGTELSPEDILRRSDERLSLD